MTSDRPRQARARPPGARRPGALSPRRELLAVLLLGAAGTGLVFLAMRQGWAQVRTAVPAPLPSSVVTDSGQSLAPYADALAIAALASLAAVLATRRMARRVTGGLLAILGVGIAAAVSFGVTTSAAVAAAAGSAGSGAAAAAGNTAGSATEGSSQPGAIMPAVAGFHSRAVLTAASWQAMAIVGALAVVAAGVLVMWRAERLPVMSSRYESPAARDATALRPSPHPPGSAAARRGDQPGSGEAGSRPGGPPAEPDRADAASMWESLSRGEDPTAAGRAG